MDRIDSGDVSDIAALVQNIVNESGDPAGFDAHAWTLQWLHRPAPALGGVCPAQYLGTPEGEVVVETLIRQMQSGAYS